MSPKAGNELTFWHLLPRLEVNVLGLMPEIRSDVYTSMRGFHISLVNF